MNVTVFGLWHLGCVTAACLAEAGFRTFVDLRADAEAVEAARAAAGAAGLTYEWIPVAGRRYART